MSRTEGCIHNIYKLYKLFYMQKSQEVKVIQLDSGTGVIVNTSKRKSDICATTATATTTTSVKEVSIHTPRHYQKKVLLHNHGCLLPPVLQHVDTADVGFVYLLITEEQYIAKKPIYKFGFTRHGDVYKRIHQYPKGSILLYCQLVMNASLLETHILRKLRGAFSYCRNIGKEYFEGELNDILTLIKHEIDQPVC